MKYLAWIGFALALFILGYLGTLTAYRQHLLFDVTVYFSRAGFLFQNKNLTGVENEYLPLATGFFALFSPVFFFSNKVEVYELVFKMGNSLLLLLLAWLVYRYKSWKGLVLFDFFVLVAGPIILYRFELLVIILMILSVLVFQKKRFTASAILLSLGMLTKLYPLLLLPYFCVLAWRQKNLREAGHYLLVFTLTTAVGILLYFVLTHTGIKELIGSLDYHKDKPLGLDGPLGGTIQLINYLKLGHTAPLVARHFTWGVDDNFLIVPMTVLTYLWIIPVGAFYIWLWFSKTKQANFLFVITFLMSFFVFF